MELVYVSGRKKKLSIKSFLKSPDSIKFIILQQEVTLKVGVSDHSCSKLNDLGCLAQNGDCDWSCRLWGDADGWISGVDASGYLSRNVDMRIWRDKGGEGSEVNVGKCFNSISPIADQL